MKYCQLAARFMCAAVIGSISFTALSGTSIDAEALQQRNERERLKQGPKRIFPDKPITLAETKPASGLMITVEVLRFAGNTLLAPKQLAPALPKRSA